jgi:hypothetical protein
MFRKRKSRLTGSRKKGGSRQRTPRPNSPTNRIALLDALTERRERVEMIARLLEACADPEQLTPALAARAGYFMEMELTRIGELVSRLEEAAR